MSTKNFNFGDDVCHYKDVSHKSDFEYVRPCENGKKCLILGDISNDADESPYEIRKCIDYPYLNRALNDDCNDDEECPNTLKCTSNKCAFNGNTPYEYMDDDSTLVRYCPYGKVFDISTDNCAEKTNGDKCKVNDENGVPQEGYNPGYFKICGLIDLQLKTGSNSDYYIKTVSSSFYGSVADNSFVEDKFACEHGFALYFYGNGKYRKENNPLNTGSTVVGTHKMYLKCVTVTGVDEENNVIKYKIGDSGTEQYYLMNEVPSDFQITIDQWTMTKLEIFQNYKKRYDEIKEECAKLLYLDELETCRDDELRKWWYFYGKPEEYILYQNEPMIMEYLIQTEYPNYKAEHFNSGGFLSLNILILLFALISF